MPRRRTALARALVSLSTIVASLVLLLPSAGSAVDQPDGAEVHVVRAGDTLWEIAEAVTPRGDDVRRTVFEIRRLNGLSSSVILPGTRLRMPARDRG